MAKKWDFSGWATKANIKCTDGRTILENAFAGNDGMTVPLVWNHQHNDISQVLGHAYLENRGDGVYAYCSFNDNELGQEAKELVRHGDVRALSIYANQLVQSSKMPPCDVIHGNIREVSLVLAGANQGALIDNVMMHSGEIIESEAEIFHGDYDEDFYIYDDEEVEHADNEDEESGSASGKTVKQILDGLTDEQKAAVGVLIDQLTSKKSQTVKHADSDDEEDEEEDEDETDEKVDSDKDADEEDEEVEEDTDEDEDDEDDVKHADSEDEDDGETVGDVLKTFTPQQRKVVQILVGKALEGKNEKSEEDESDMKHNVFDNYESATYAVDRETQAAIIKHAADSRDSLKNVIYGEMAEGGVLAHAITDHNNNSITYGVANIDYLFPDAKSLNNPPELIGRNQDWVTKVINGTHHTPFSRVKSLFADIREEDARARGYIKGDQKISEVIPVLTRETTPQTIYKLQKLDRDDILDITDFDVVAWLKAEMQIMLKEEIDRAILIGDGRQTTDRSKIKELNVRPIYNDDDLYTVKVPVNVASTADDNDVAAAVIKAVIKSRRLYKGSGNPSFFINEEYLANLLLLEDGMGRRIYETEASLAAALRVKELVPVELMENKTIAIPTGQGTATADKPLIGIIVNLQDYNIGADKGGQTSFFDDFDIDFNKFEYLYETRMSGALIKPFSAMSIYENRAS